MILQTCSVLSTSLSFGRKMSIFTQRFNSITGKLEWGVHNEDYDYQQEVARSAYADMLHDWERNMKYHRALKTAIEDLRKSNKKVIVLDIGTGSGLLAMMAAKYGADSVYACEAFKPAADCARRVISDNRLGDKIKLIEKRSTDLTVGENCDLSEKANLLVTEVFDTELIGEGALSTFSHALNNLLTRDCAVIPSYAVVYAQVAQSSSIRAWHSLSDLNLHGTRLETPEAVKCCAGAPAVHDLQLSQLDESEFLPLTAPTVVKTFDFTGAQKLDFHASSAVDVTAIGSGKTEIVFMWWDIEMYPGGDILSCAPKWAHPDGPHNLPWRDHWMQAVYYPSPIDVIASESFRLGTHHDEYSFWFTTQKQDEKFKSVSAPACTCSMHMLNSRNRVGMLNDTDRYNMFALALSDIDSPESKVVFVCGESIPLAIVAARMGFRKVFLSATELHQLQIVCSYLKANRLESNVKVIGKSVNEISQEDLENKKIDVVLAEPFFSSSVLQWDNIHFWYVCEQLTQHLDCNAVIIPREMQVHGVAAQFTDLWKIRAPVRQTEGFDLSHFDAIIQDSIHRTDCPVEPQPLWEYPSVPLSREFQVCTFNFDCPLPISPVRSDGHVNFATSGTCNGLALWARFVLNNRIAISLGPVQPLECSKNISWYRHSQQGVQLVTPQGVTEQSSLNFGSTFDPQNGTLSFEFNFNTPVNDT